MDVTSTLKGDAFRPFATLVAPGAIGVAPWALQAYAAGVDAKEFWDKHPIATGVALFIISVAAGLIFENIGARIETKIDNSLTDEEPDHLEVWHRYLLITFETEPVGQRYLRSILFRMKFELAFLSSLPVQVLGWLVFAQHQGASSQTLLLLGAVGLLLGVWFSVEARDSARILGGVRRWLVEHFGHPQRIG